MSRAGFIELLREIGCRYGALSEREFRSGRPSLNLQPSDGSRLLAVAWCATPAVGLPGAQAFGHDTEPLTQRQSQLSTRFLTHQRSAPENGSRRPSGPGLQVRVIHQRRVQRRDRASVRVGSGTCEVGSRKFVAERDGDADVFTL